MSKLKQRLITGALLSALAIVLLMAGGAVMAVAALLFVCVAMHEEYHALTIAGNRPVAWPTWVGIVLSVPLSVWLGTAVLIPLLMLVFLVTLVCVVFREEPRLEDALLSIMPMFTVMLPGLCVVALAMVQPKELQVTLLFLALAIPCIGDTFAFVVGSTVGGPKLCPAVSPNKTVSGAIAGLVGSLLTALGIGLAAHLMCDEAVRMLLPAWWQYILMGLLGGAAGQMGDLFASLVKRHCGLKDFSNLFPGHGGMLDRIDSILFSSMVIFCFLLMM